MGPPAIFYPALLLYSILPLHAPLTLFVFDAPFGRFVKNPSRRWYFNGNISWMCMEIVAPITMITTIYGSNASLTTHSKIVAAAYLLHYLQRAIISPLVLSPQRSPLHIIVPLCAGFYNLLNAFCLAIGLIYYPSDVSQPFFSRCMIGWALGLFNNVYHDEILNDLRRPDSQRVFGPESKDEKLDKKAVPNGRYAIPRGGLYSLISFPNYLCEWFEWSCFALASAPSLLIPIPPLHQLDLVPSIPWLVEYLEPMWPSKLPHPSWMFVIFLISAMLPRAIRGHRWYIDTFKDRFPRSRKAVIPFLL